MNLIPFIICKYGFLESTWMSVSSLQSSLWFNLTWYKRFCLQSIRFSCSYSYYYCYYSVFQLVFAFKQQLYSQFSLRPSALFNVGLSQKNQNKTHSNILQHNKIKSLIANATLFLCVTYYIFAKTISNQLEKDYYQQ